MAIIPGVYQAKNAISDNSQQGSKFNSIVNAIVNPANTSLLTGFDPVIEEVSNPNAGTVVTYMPHTVSGTPPLALPNSAGQPLQAWSVDLLPYQEGTGDPSPDNVRAIHGTDKVTITTAGRNMLPNTATTQTINGVTFTVNADGSVTANGTATENAQLDVGSYTSTGMLVVASGCPANGSNTTYRMFSTYIGADYGNGVTSVASQFPSGRVSNVKIFVYSGYTAENLTFYPMIKFVDVPAGYTPYLAPSQTVLALPQTVYTGTIGSEGGESRTAKRTFTGSAEEQWALSSAWSKDNTAVFYAQSQLTDAINADNNATYITNCNSFVPKSRNTLYELDTPCIGYSGTLNAECFLTVRIAKTIAASLYQFRTYLASNPLEIVYELATPTTFAVPSVTIPTPTGTATTWATAEDGTAESMEVTYLENT